MDNKVNRSPLSFELFEDRSDIIVDSNIARQDNFGLKTFCEGTDPFLQGFVEGGT